MAVYHTLFIECYREEDALRLHEQLKHWLWEVNGHSVSMAQCVMEPANGFWNVHANPLGPGYSRFGYVEGMNEPLVLEMLENELSNASAQHQAYAGRPVGMRVRIGF